MADGASMPGLGLALECSACWGAPFSGGVRCPPNFVPGKLHFKNKFCGNCRNAITVPLTHVRSLNLAQAMAFVNKRSEGFWNHEPANLGGGQYRIINNTAGCVGPWLALFRDAAPYDTEWSAVPEQWAGDDGLLHLCVAKGTLVPAKSLRQAQKGSIDQRGFDQTGIEQTLGSMDASKRHRIDPSGVSPDLLGSGMATAERGRLPGQLDLEAFAPGAAEVLPPLQAQRVAPAAGSNRACRAYPTQPVTVQAVAMQGSLQSGMQGGRHGEPSAHKLKLQQCRAQQVVATPVPQPHPDECLSLDPIEAAGDASPMRAHASPVAAHASFMTDMTDERSAEDCIAADAMLVEAPEGFTKSFSSDILARPDSGPDPNGDIPARSDPEPDPNGEILESSDEVWRACEAAMAGASDAGPPFQPMPEDGQDLGQDLSQDLDRDLDQYLGRDLAAAGFEEDQLDISGWSTVSTCPTDETVSTDESGPAAWGHINKCTMRLASLDEASSCGPWLHDNLDSHAKDTQAIASDTSTDGEGRVPEPGGLEVLHSAYDVVNSTLDAVLRQGRLSREQRELVWDHLQRTRQLQAELSGDPPPQRQRSHRGQTARHPEQVGSVSAAGAVAAEAVARTTSTTAMPAAIAVPASQRTDASTAIAAASVACAAAKLLRSSNTLLATSWQANGTMIELAKRHVPNNGTHARSAGPLGPGKL